MSNNGCRAQLNAPVVLLVTVVAVGTAVILVGWREENGDLAAIAEAHDDKRLLTVRTRAMPTTLDDLSSVRAFVDRLEERSAA